MEPLLKVHSQTELPIHSVYLTSCGAWCDLVLLNGMPKEQTELVIRFLVWTQLIARDIEYNI